MPEPSGLIERIAADLADVRWPDAAEIRARLTRRRRRRAVAASGLATVVAIAVAVPAVLNTGGDDSGPPVAGAEQLVEIPPEALLQPEDVGPGLVALRETIAENENVGDVHLLDLLADTCPAYRSLSIYAGPYRYQRSYSVQTPPTDPGDPTTGDAVLRQYVLRLDGDLASRVADDLMRAAVDVRRLRLGRACARPTRVSSTSRPSTGCGSCPRVSPVTSRSCSPTPRRSRGSTTAGRTSSRPPVSRRWSASATW